MTLWIKLKWTCSAVFISFSLACFHQRLLRLSTNTSSTGQSSQQVTRSWWPSVQIWRNNMRLGFWNNEYESFFNTRLEELQSGTAVPLTSEQWRKKIRPFAVVRRAFDHTSKSADSLLHSLLHGM